MGLPLWLGTVPDYEVKNGNMHVTVGEFVLAMPVNVSTRLDSWMLGNTISQPSD